MTKRTILMISLALGIALSSHIPVYAVANGEPNRERIREMQEVREQKKEENGNLIRNLKDKAASAQARLREMVKGITRLKDVTLTSVSGTMENAVLVVKTKEGASVSVTTDSKTQFRRKYWGKIESLSEMQPGHMLMVMGTWTDDAKTALKARFIRDVSIQKRYGTFIGKVTALSSDGFTLETQRGAEAVTLTSSAKITDRAGKVISQSEILVGHRVRVKGLWDNMANTITQVSEAKDYTLPVRVKPTGSVKPTVTPKPLETVTPTPTPTTSPAI